MNNINDSSDTVLILTQIVETTGKEKEVRGPLDFIKGRVQVAEVSARVLAENTRLFFDNIAEVIKAGDAQISSYSLETIEITAAITASGKLTLVGGGIEGSVQGGIKFTFKRPQEESKTPSIAKSD